MFVGFPGTNRNSRAASDRGSYRRTNGSTDTGTGANARTYGYPRACKRVLQRRPGDH